MDGVWGTTGMKRAMMILLLLAGCGRGPDEHICSTPDPIPAVGDWDGCVHRWAYRLASTEGAVQVIAKAVVAGCSDAVKAAVERVLTGEEAPPDGPPVPLEKQAMGKALFYVAQARAGRCAIP